MRGRILMVDDEPRILDGLRRSLRGKYPISTANSGPEGLEVLAAPLEEGEEPFAVVVSDMMMPGMNGAQFLIKAREVVPDAVLMILSGQADMTSTIAAVNQANLFRFLTKPCETDELTKAFDGALRQYELITSEREILQKTLRGAVDVLTEVLSLASASASRRTNQMKTMVIEAAKTLGVDDWRLPLAAMLSQVGTLAVPPELLSKVEMGVKITEEDFAVFAGHPEVARGLLERIPRLEEIAAWIGSQPTTLPVPLAKGEEKPVYSELSPVILAVAAHFVVGIDQGRPRDEMERRLTSSGRYPEKVIQAVGWASEKVVSVGVLREISVAQIRSGMVLEEDVMTVSGMVLLRKGEQITEVSRARVVNFAASAGVIEPIQVITGVGG